MLRILEHTLVKNNFFVYSQFKTGYLLTRGWNCKLNFEKQLRENNLGFIEFIFILIKNDWKSKAKNGLNFIKRFIGFYCVCLPACMHVYHVRAWWLWSAMLMLRPEKSSRGSYPPSHFSTISPTQGRPLKFESVYCRSCVLYCGDVCFAVFSKRYAISGLTAFHAGNVDVGVMATVV